MQLRLVIDRIEDNTAVLLVQPDETDTIHWPTSSLPADISEGDILDISIEVDQDATADALQRSADMIQRLRRKRNNNTTTD